MRLVVRPIRSCALEQLPRRPDQGHERHPQPSVQSGVVLRSTSLRPLNNDYENTRRLAHSLRVGEVCRGKYFDPKVHPMFLARKRRSHVPKVSPSSAERRAPMFPCSHWNPTDACSHQTRKRHVPIGRQNHWPSPRHQSSSHDHQSVIPPAIKPNPGQPGDR